MLNLQTINLNDFLLDNIKIKNIIVYDIETYKNYFLVCYTSITDKVVDVFCKNDLDIKYIDSRDKKFIDKMKELFNYDIENLTLFVGYNNKFFDDRVIAYFLKHVRNNMDDLETFLSDLKDFANTIVDRSNDLLVSSYYPRFCSVDIQQEEQSFKNQSLKDLEARFGMEIQKEDESSFDLAVNLDDKNELDRIINYCKHDVFATAVLVLMSLSDNYYVTNFYNKLKLFDLYITNNISEYNTKKEMEKILLRVGESPASISAKFFTEKNDDILYKNKSFYNVNKKFEITEPKVKNGIAHRLYEEKLKDIYYVDDSIKADGLIINFGTGGVHTTYDTNDKSDLRMYENVYNYDVTSYYPNFLAKLDAIANLDLKRFKDTITQRTELKQQKDNKKAQALQNALKLALNSLSGKFNNAKDYNIHYNPVVYFSMTTTCQLLLVELYERLSKYIRLVQLNTDGIAFTMKDGYCIEDVSDIINGWEDDYGYGLEETFYNKFFQVSVNDYMAVYTDNKTGKTKVKCKGMSFVEYNDKGVHLKSSTKPNAIILQQAFLNVNSIDNLDDIIKQICIVVDELVAGNSYNKMQLISKGTGSTKADNMVIRNVETGSDSGNKRGKGVRVLFTKNSNYYTEEYKITQKNRKQNCYITFDLYSNDLADCKLELSAEKYILYTVNELIKLKPNWISEYDTFDKIIALIKNVEYCSKYNFDDIVIIKNK